MKKILSICLLSMATFFLAGCGQKVEVPPAMIGKILTKNGYQEGYKDASKFRLEKCWFYCDKLVLLDVADFKMVEPFTLFMPKDRLKMDFKIRLTMTVNPESFDMLFNKIPPVNKGEQLALISLSKAYETYAAPILRSEIREFMSNYSIMEVANNRDKIGTELSKHLISKISNKQTPFELSYAGLAEVAYPPLIVKAQEAAAERREEINKEKAELEVSKVQLERKLQEQQLQRKVDVEKATAESQVNKILGDSITPRYIKYRQLGALDKIAESDNTKFVPFDMLSTMGAQVMMGNEAK